MRIILSACVALLAAGCGGDAAGAKAVLRFSAIPDQNSTELREKFGRIAAYLSEELGVEAEYVPARKYSASVEMFRNGDIQLAWFGGLTGVQARAAVKGARAIAQGREDPEYYSYFIAHVSTGLERSDEFPAAIAKLRFTFGSESSTSGRLMPEHFIREHSGTSPEEFFGRPNHYSGAHDKTAKLVESGQFQAGALSYKTYDGLVARKELDPEVCRIVWRTPPYADYNWTAHPDLEERFGEGFTEKLQAALLALSGDLLDVFPRSGMIEAGNEDFGRIEQVARDLGMLR